jgi:hypothetical protein
MWIYKNKILSEIPKDAVGFVYKIKRINLEENLTSPMYYIGKKNFYKKNKKRKIIESDWREYYGSSKWLLDDIKKFGTDSFEREILRICYSKTEMTYYEVMTQINEECLRVDQDSIMKKKYYNLNILGKFFKMKEFSKAEIAQIKNYINTGAEYYNKISVTNGKKNKYINTLVEDIGCWLDENPGWYVGSCTYNPIKDKVQYTNGEDFIYIDEEDSKIFLDENPDWYKGSPIKGKFSVVNNGYENKRIKKDEIERFLNENPDYELGAIKTGENPLIHIFHPNKKLSLYVRSKDLEEYISDGWEEIKGVPKDTYIWITNGKISKKINKNDFKEYENDGWRRGRHISYKGTINITDGVNNKRINKDEDIPEGWYRGHTQIRNKIPKKKYVHNPETGEMFCLLEDKVDEFLEENPSFIKGKNYSSSQNKVYCINMKTLEKVTVTPEEYKNNPLLTSIKTKKVKIKKKNKIIFKGYLKLYCQENKEIPIGLFQEALRSESGFLIRKTGKYKWVTEEKYHISYL